MKYLLLVCMLVVSGRATHADELQDRLVSAIQAYAELTPDYPDVAIGWAQVLVDDAAARAAPQEIISTGQIGAWIARSQPVDTDPALRAQRVEWLAKAFMTAFNTNTKFPTSFPPQDIRVAELRLRLKTAVDDVMPGPSAEERAAAFADFVKAHKLEEAEMVTRRELNLGVPSR